MIDESHVIPKLNTSFDAPLFFLEKQFLSHQKEIDAWFKNQWQLTLPPVYGSVDLRNAGFKLAPIDMNLFPAGFNNLNPDFLTIAVSAVHDILMRYLPNTKRILIIPESHTRNLFYFENVKTLEIILKQAGFEVRVGSLLEEITESREIELAKDKLTLEPLLRVDNQLQTANFIPDLILLNNDLSDGIPEILQNVKQPLLPPAKLGWSHRLKSEHFQYYQAVSDEFANHLEIDPWLIAPYFQHCGKIDFMQQEGMTCLTKHAENLFLKIQKKYDEYKIPHKPFLIVKAEAGTYGMAVMTVRHPDELKNMNRKQRTKMATTKGGQPVHSVIIQEGVYTFETFGEEQAVAEPVVYLWGDSVVGGFYRVHKDRDVDENLNAPGMQFQPLAFTAPCNNPSVDLEPHACPNRLYAYGIVAKLSMLAAAREIDDQVKEINVTIKLGVIMDPIESIDIKKDTTFGMLLEAQKRNYEIHYFEQKDLFLLNGIAFGESRLLTVFQDESRWHARRDKKTIPLSDLNVILMRKDPPVDQAYLYTTYLLDYAARSGVLIMNAPQGLRYANEKLFATVFPQCCPPHLVTHSIAALKLFKEEHLDIVCKPLNGMQGESIFRITKNDPNANVIFEMLTHQETRLIMAQQYIPEISKGDKRIIMIDGEPIPHALARIPQEGDWRGNLAAGAVGKAQSLSERDRWICAEVGPTLLEHGLYFVGLDVIGDYLTEVNVTSPTGLVELDEQLNINIAAQFLEVVEKKLANHSL